MNVRVRTRPPFYPWSMSQSLSKVIQAEALFKATIKSPAGDVTFDERGFPNTGAFTVQMQNGKVNVVWPPEIATGKLAWPSPSWQQ